MGQPGKVIAKVLPVPGENPSRSAWLWIILLLSLLINLCGINWGLPSFRGWAPDELTPSLVMHGIGQRFSNGWHGFYPPFHYYLLSACALPFYGLHTLHLIDIHDFRIHVFLFLTGRLLSVIMAAGTIYLIYRCGLELFDRMTARIAALIYALIPPFVYYAKTTNLDVPYVFWFVLSLYFYIRILKQHRTVDYTAFTLTAVLAVCTKDQAVGLYALAPVPVIITRVRTIQDRGFLVRILKSCFNRQTAISLTAACVLFFMVYNVPFNHDGMIRHFRLITGPSIDVYRLFAPTFSGHVSMAFQGIKHIIFMLGWPVFIAFIAGSLHEFLRKKKHALLSWLWIFPVSYYLTFICRIGYHYVRFFLPVAVILVFYAAYGIRIFLVPEPQARLKILRYSIMAAVFCYAMLYAVSVDMLMIGDARYDAERWLKTRVRPDERIVLTGWMEYLPRNRDLNAEYLRDPGPGILLEKQPEYLVLNADFCKCDSIRGGLTDGSLGYTRVAVIRNMPFPSRMLVHDIYRNGRRNIFTNLDKINPVIHVYARNTGP